MISCLFFTLFADGVVILDNSPADLQQRLDL